MEVTYIPELLISISETTRHNPEDHSEDTHIIIIIVDVVVFMDYVMLGLFRPLQE
jgi:hypothetical protein